MTATFEDFAYAFPSPHRDAARLSERLADVYWRARRSGYHHDNLVALVQGITWADNPVGAAIKRLRDAVEQPPKPTPPARRALNHDPHKPCPDGHPGCVLCGCDGPVVHHVAEPMPDWFRAGWRNLLQGTVIP